MRLASNNTIKKSVTTKPTTPHFSAPRMVSTISVSTVTAASLDSRERVRDLLPNASSCKKRIVYPGRPLMPPVRLSLCRERLAWGVPHRATLLTPQQDVVKHAAWEIRTCREALPVPATLPRPIMQRAGLYMYHYSRHLRAVDKSYLTQNVRSSNIRSV